MSNYFFVTEINVNIPEVPRPTSPIVTTVLRSLM